MKLQAPLKVSVSLSHGFHPSWVTLDGLKFNDAFIDRLHGKEEFFRERIILQINEIAGNDWGVGFVEEPTINKSYLVDITVSNDAHIRPIAAIIIAAFPEYDLSFFRRTDRFEHLGRVKARV